MEKRNFIDNLKSLAIIIALAILIPMVSYYGATLLAPPPSYHAQPLAYNSGGVAMYSADQVKSAIAAKSYSNQEQLAAWQSKIVQMQKFVEKSQQLEKRYSKTLFTVAVTVGIIFLLFGLLANFYTLDTGFILGGVFSILTGYTSFWRFLPSIAQFLSLFIALALVIVITYFKLIRSKPGE